MADIFIKNVNGEIWKNTNGAILKAKKFNDNTANRAKISVYASGNYQSIGGYASIWYDEFGTNNIIQTTIANRFKIVVNRMANIPTLEYLNAENVRNPLCKMKMTDSVTFRSLYLVMNHSAVPDPESLFLNYNTILRNSISPTYLISGGISISRIVANNADYTVGTAKPYGNYIIYIEFSSNKTINNTTDSILSDFNGYGYSWSNIAHLELFSDVHTTMEINYNINALNAKYSIF